MNKIIHKDVCGFWIFKNRYSMIIEDENEGLTEVLVDKQTFNRYNIGDIYEKISWRKSRPIRETSKFT